MTQKFCICGLAQLAQLGWFPLLFSVHCCGLVSASPYCTLARWLWHEERVKMGYFRLCITELYFITFSVRSCNYIILANLFFGGGGGGTGGWNIRDYYPTVVFIFAYSSSFNPAFPVAMLWHAIYF